jgi:hypothetical protein
MTIRWFQSVVAIVLGAHFALPLAAERIGVSLSRCLSF